MIQPRPRIFIGYSLRDNDYVADLAAFLSARGFASWFQGARDFGKDWRPTVRQALEKSDALLVVRSCNSVYGVWIAREIAWARALELPIFVIQIDGREMLPLKGAWVEDGREFLMPSAEMLSHLSGVMIRHHSGSWPELATPSLRAAVTGIQKTLGPVQLHGGLITELCVSPKDRFIAAVGVDGIVKILDPLNNRALSTGMVSEDWLWSVDWHPAGSWLAVCGNDGSLRLIDDIASAVELKSKFEFSFEDWLLCAKFSPDGSMLAVAGFDGYVTLWRVSEWAIIHRLRGDGDWLYALAWSPYGDRIAAAGEGGVIFVWETPWDKPYVELRGHSERLFGLDFSPDGKWLISASGDTTIRLWETLSSSTRQIWTGHTGWVLSVKVSPDGRYVLSTSNDGSARVWLIAFDQFDSYEVIVGGWVTSCAWKGSQAFILGTSEGAIFEYSIASEAV